MVADGTLVVASKHLVMGDAYPYGGRTMPLAVHLIRLPCRRDSPNAPPFNNSEITKVSSDNILFPRLFSSEINLQNVIIHHLLVHISVHFTIFDFHLGRNTKRKRLFYAEIII